MDLSAVTMKSAAYFCALGLCVAGAGVAGAGVAGVAYASHGDDAHASGESVTDSAQAAAKFRALLGARYTPAEFLDVDEAFRLRIEAVDGNHLSATFDIAAGYYLYRSKIGFHVEGAEATESAESAESASAPTSATQVAVQLPPGELKTDAYFGEMAVFKHNFSAPMVLTGATQAATRLIATYQGCADGGICYAPVSKTYALDLSKNLPKNLPQITPAGDFPPPTINQTIAPAIAPAVAPAVAPAIAPSPLKILIGAFIAGLLLTFTPCVLPMVPILSAILVGHGATITRARGSMLALAYVSGTMLVYAAMGALAGAAGAQLQAYFQNIWAVGGLAAVLLLMATAMFGRLRIQLPARLQSAITTKTRALHGSLPLVFALGVASAAVVGACVSPLLISFLGLAIAAGDPWMGARMMTAMALGMGVPLLALGLGAGHLLPKAGAWMGRVNHLFGIMLVGVAIYLLSTQPALPALLLWGGGLLGLGVYVWRWARSAAAGGWRYAMQCLAVALAAWGALASVGGLFGAREVLKPWPAQWVFIASPEIPRLHATPFTRVASSAELDQHFARAAAANKWVLLDYYAQWCVDCVRMEATFADPRVRDILRQHFILLQVDVTEPRDAAAQALKQRFQVFGPPALLFFDRDGGELTEVHFYGYRSAEQFLALLRAIIAPSASPPA